MKKTLTALFLTLAMCMSLGIPAFATNTAGKEVKVASADVEADSTITPYASTAFNFTLTSGNYKLSSEEYVIKGEDATLNIESMTWTPGSYEVHVGWYNVDTGNAYYYDGDQKDTGSISNVELSSNGVPDGNYKIYVKHMGTGSRTITGTLKYSVD